MSRCAKKLAIAAALVAAAIVTFLLTWQRLPTWLLLRDESPDGAQVAFLLMGSVPDRTLKAYDLLRESRVSRLVFVRDQRDTLEKLGYRLNGGDATLDYLKRLGAEPTSIEYLGDKEHTSTREEADTLVALARQRGWRRVALVTSWYHTARAAWIFEKVAQGNPVIIPVAATAQDNRPEDWWQHEGAFLAVFNEYLKWLFYLVTYR